MTAAPAASNPPSPMDVDWNEISGWVIPPAILIAAVLLGYVVRRWLIDRLGALTRRTSTDVDDIAFRALRPHVPLWFFLGGLVLATESSSEFWISRWRPTAGRIAAAGFMISLTFVAARLGGLLIERYAKRVGGSVAAASVIRQVIRLVILAVGVLLVLSNLGVEITPLLTALGVGSLAVALALQPTLANLFAGIHIAVAHPVRVGDFVQVEGEIQGYVTDIGWRTTRIRTLSNNAIFVPNGKLSEMVVVNYDQPESEQACTIEVTVAYGNDLREVERVAVEVARDVMRTVEGGVAAFEPFIRFHTLAHSAVNFTAILRIKTFPDQFLVKHEFIARLATRFREAGIEPPLPHRVLSGELVVRNDGAAPAAGVSGAD